MATVTFDKLQDTAASVADRVKEAAQHAGDFAREARDLKGKASEALEDGVHRARRTVKRGLHDLEDLRDEAVVQVKRKPLAAIGVTFMAGLVVGVCVGLLGRRGR